MGSTTGVSHRTSSRPNQAITDRPTLKLTRVVAIARRSPNFQVFAPFCASQPQFAVSLNPSAIAQLSFRILSKSKT